ncbi:MAG: sensor histidine kinase [Myxococcaceae bacterium]
MTEPLEASELKRLKQRFVTRTRALTLLRLCLLAIAQFFIFDALWAGFALLGILFSYLIAPHPKWGRLVVFLSLNIDLAWQAYAISQTGFFQSPLVGTLPAITLVFAILFHQPFLIVPPLLLLPILTCLDPEVPIRILALYSLLNACSIYLTNKILGEEETTSYQIWKLEQALKNQAVTEERQRISRDIHDGVGTSLSALIMQAEHLGYYEIRDMAKEALQETRYAISILRDDLDFKFQIKNYVDLFSKRHQIQTNLEINPGVSDLSDRKALSILRILQESLTNIAKHAQASSIEIKASLEQNQFLLHIKDDGIGFDPKNIPQHHYGIRNIEERVRQMGGTFEIYSQSNLGTQIEIGASL